MGLTKSLGTFYFVPRDVGADSEKWVGHDRGVSRRDKIFWCAITEGISLINKRRIICEVVAKFNK
jgi:hypothetical protein